MNVGMLWFDNDVAKELAERIERAADFYLNKYGREPNVCFLHPETGNGDFPREIGGLTIRTSESVLANHFWLGVEEREAAA